MFVVVLFAGCKKDTFEETIGLCPIVVSTNPVDLATGVPLNQIITVNFNEQMNPSTITNSSYVIMMGATQIAGQISYSGNTATFTSANPLAQNTTYTGIVKTTVKDLNGNALQTNYVWTFSTGLTLIPVVIFTDPAHNDVGVVLNKTIVAQFNMQMDGSSINNTNFTLKQGTNPITGIVSYNGTDASFTPTLDLLPNTVYTATITSGVKNTVGTFMATDTVWNFTTGTQTAPKVKCHDPASNSTGVVLNKVVSACFTMKMDPSTLNNATFTLKHGTTPVVGTIVYVDSFVTFTPTLNLLSGTVYTATITTGAKNLAGIPLANDFVWSFTTIANLGPQGVNLNSAARFGILAGVGVSNNAGFSVINDLDVGISPGVRSSVTGFPPAIIVNGAIYASDDLTPPGTPAMLIQAKLDLTNAYLFAEAAVSPAPATVAGDLGGTTLAPGIYKSTSTLLVQSGNLTLDAQGDVNAVWIFQIASDFTTVGGAGGNVYLTGGAQAKNVFWQVGSSATIGDYTSFKGNILALTSITMNSHATAEGRMLCRNGSVTMTSTNIINKP